MRGFTSWHVKRTDLSGADSGAYAQPKTVGNPSPEPGRASCFVYAETVEEATALGAQELGVSIHQVSVQQANFGFGVGESG